MSKIVRIKLNNREKQLIYNYCWLSEREDIEFQLQNERRKTIDVTIEEINDIIKDLSLECCDSNNKKSLIFELDILCEQLESEIEAITKNIKIIKLKDYKEINKSKFRNDGYLQKILDSYCPDRQKSEMITSSIKQDMKKYKISLMALENGFKKYEKYLSLIEKEENKFPETKGTWNQGGYTRAVFKIICDEFWHDYEIELPEQYLKVFQKWRKKLNKK